MKKLLIATLCAAAIVLPRSAGAASPQSVQTAHTFNFTTNKTAALEYLLFLPKGYDKNGSKEWPLIYFLHGAGERGKDIWKVAVHGPPKVVAQRTDFPFIVVSPQCPDNQTWEREALLGLLDDVCSTHKVDKNRVYLTGLSMGGYGSWDLGLAYPERFAAIAPICGGGNIIGALLTSPEKQKALRNMGVWAFHGAKDSVVPLSESERMVNVLKRAGFNQVKLTVYPEANHDSWTETYNDQKLYDWFLEHSRK